LNFVFAGLSLLNALGLLAVLAFSDKLAQSAATDEDRAVFESLQSVGTGVWAFMLVVNVLVVALLIISGVGYLKTRMWGRRIGSVYALLSIGDAIATVFILPAAFGGFGIQTLIALVYPVLTLILLNTTFKDDFV
jgi:hypothetical protein